MQIETVENFQLHLIAHELPNGKWDPFVSIFQFNESAQDFKCVYERHRASEEPLDSSPFKVTAFQGVSDSKQ